MKHNIIYHNQDLDGYCSGAIIKYYLLNETSALEEDIRMIGWNYGDADPTQIDGKFYITDVSFPENVMISLRSANDEVTWIDHHKSSIEESIGKWDWFLGIRRVGDSASFLAWEYFFPNTRIPNVVKYVDLYDVWKKDTETPWEDIMQAQWGMRKYLKDPSDKDDYWVWELELQSKNISDYIWNEGVTIYDHIIEENKTHAKNAFDLQFEGMNCCALNIRGNSEVVASVVREDHDCILYFRYTKGKWAISLYANEKNPNKIDLSLIAKDWGGGGHWGASGFEVNDINFILNPQ